eukprot:14533786-Alexandrium_andersonii.AAC.1
MLDCIVLLALALSLARGGRLVRARRVSPLIRHVGQEGLHAELGLALLLLAGLGLVDVLVRDKAALEGGLPGVSVERLGRQRGDGELHALFRRQLLGQRGRELHNQRAVDVAQGGVGGLLNDGRHPARDHHVGVVAKGGLAALHVDAETHRAGAVVLAALASDRRNEQGMVHALRADGADHVEAVVPGHVRGLELQG